MHFTKHMHGAMDTDKRLSSHSGISFTIFTDVSSIRPHNNKQFLVYSIRCSALNLLVLVAIVCHNVCKDWHATLLSVNIKDFALNKLQLTTGSTARIA